eukprot:2954187-Rhodomonas_salina.3
MGIANNAYRHTARGACARGHVSADSGAWGLLGRSLGSESRHAPCPGTTPYSTALKHSSDGLNASLATHCDTGPAYGAATTAARSLRAFYAVSGTDSAYDATRRAAIRYSCARRCGIGVCVRYVVSGSDIVYGAIRPQGVSSRAASADPHPTLPKQIRISATAVPCVPGARLRVFYFADRKDSATGHCGHCMRLELGESCKRWLKNKDSAAAPERKQVSSELLRSRRGEGSVVDFGARIWFRCW